MIIIINVYRNDSNKRPGQKLFEICLSKNIKKRKFHDLTYTWGECGGKVYQNKENFEIYTLFIANISNWGQLLGQLINFHT